MRIPIESPLEYLARRTFPDYRSLTAEDHSPFRGSENSPKPPTEDRFAEFEEWWQWHAAIPASQLDLLVLGEKQKEARELLKLAEEKEQKPFSHQQAAPADFDFSSNAAYWTVDEAVAPAFGKSPDAVKSESVLEASRPDSDGFPLSPLPRTAVDTRLPSVIAAEEKAARAMMESIGYVVSDATWQIWWESQSCVLSLPRADVFAELVDRPTSATYWRRVEGWTFNQAALLLVGVDPNRLDAWLKAGGAVPSRFTLPAHHAHLQEFMAMAETMGRLRFPARPADVVRWAAKENRIAVPRALRDLAQARTGDSADDRADFAALVLPLWQSCANQAQVFAVVAVDDEFAAYRSRYKDSTLKTWIKATDQRPREARFGRPSRKG